MDFPQRLDPLDFDVAPPDEELPDYEPATAPEYNLEDYATPLHTYHLRQIDRKVQVLVPYGPSSSSSYKIVTRGVRLFTKKPEMEMFRTTHGQMSEESICGIWFDADGPLPWRPRAHFCHTDAGGLSTHSMESRNFADWTVDIGGVTYAWTLEGRPMSLVLTEKSTSIVIARFTYSARGTLATRGAEVGDLTIYRDGLSIDRAGVEKIICGLLVAISHFKKMGRHYWNEVDAPMRATSSPREHFPSPRTSIAAYSTL
ncbi:hypothetical protein BU26DRAFT_47143 [Trematosphaeria pertusa]|uniref:Uncharacterized protein n=1 Tax=Trematosphaeria pertusa TaxID=390896 RepID=A0A6A6I7Z6_9PLEO|nr:uncharacterized protein BU26DRAFT_47143 [Trematosphaeria pertusa]KAF2246491.1 hypothetical protein BU26DRAFT_47143 [Trematosphaeria pertusa]